VLELQNEQRRKASPGFFLVLYLQILALMRGPRSVFAKRIKE
jgi:hypothetical protein